MNVKLLIEHHLELQSLKGGCTGSSESPLVKMPHCWKSRVTAPMWCLVFSLVNTIKESAVISLSHTTMLLMIWFVLILFLAVNNLFGQIYLG